MRGKIKIALDDFEDGRTDFGQAFSIDPQLNRFHFHLGRTYYYEDNFETAIHHFTEEIYLLPGNGDAYYLRAVC